jgi:hypothetical protein
MEDDDSGNFVESDDDMHLEIDTIVRGGGGGSGGSLSNQSSNSSD